MSRGLVNGQSPLRVESTNHVLRKFYAMRVGIPSSQSVHSKRVLPTDTRGEVSSDGNASLFPFVRVKCCFTTTVAPLVICLVRYVEPGYVKWSDQELERRHCREADA